jgi:thioredoxin reductase (NADPH)
MTTSLLSQDKVIILGGGVSGLTAANYLARANIPVIVIEGEESLLSLASKVENWPAELSISGQELLDHMKEQAKQNGVRFLNEKVINVDFIHTPFVITTENIFDRTEKNSLRTNYCIIAMGRSIGKLNIPGEKENLGKGVYHCAMCDGPLFKNKTVAILGSGDSAISQAEYLANITKKVFIISNSSEITALDKIKKEHVLHLLNVEVIYQAQIKEIKGNGKYLDEITLEKDHKLISLKVNGLFHTLALKPTMTLFKDQLLLDEDGFIVVNNMQETSIKGVYAVGDITNEPCKQAITAAASGAKAAFYIQKVYANSDVPASNKLPLHSSRFDTIKTGYTSSIFASLPIFATQLISKKISEVAKLNDKIASGNPLLLEFYANWCGACKKVEPFLQDALVKMQNIEVIRINVDTADNVADAFKITALPTALFFNKGQLVKEAQGFVEVISLLSELGNAKNNGTGQR